MNRKSKDSSYLTRRNFLGKGACGTMAITGMVNTLAHLELMRGALAQGGGYPDYKALVVLFLFGGNDSNNMLIPRMGHPEYATYKDKRGILRIYDSNDGDYDSNNANHYASIPLTPVGGGDPYGVHPALQPMADLFNNGTAAQRKLAFVANVGTLVQPVPNRNAYLNETVPLPPQLFSHSDQQIQWQSSVPDQPFQTGWAGRAADELLANGAKGSNVSLNISIAGINKLQVGSDVNQYAVTTNGAIPLNGYGTDYSGALSGGNYLNNDSGRRLAAFDSITQHVHTHLLEESYNKVVRTARANEDLIGSAITAADETTIDNAFSAINLTQNTLANQLRMIAKLISGRSALSNDRQIFFCSAGGYDTHQDQIGAHNTLMMRLGEALGAFQSAIDGINDSDKVLTISHSDFTRTLTPNGTDTGAGSDHGWGGHQIVMGGPINGGKIYGSFPELTVSGGIDAGSNRGRWIPSTSVDQYSAVAAEWLGLNSSEIAEVFPNLSRFPSVTDPAANLGYI